MRVGGAAFRDDPHHAHGVWPRLASVLGPLAVGYEGGAMDVVRRARSWARRRRAAVALGSGLVANGGAAEGVGRAAGVRCSPEKVRSAGREAIYRLSTVRPAR